MALKDFYYGGIVVQRYTEVRDGIGGIDKQWKDFATISGVIDYFRGELEVTKAAQTTDTASYVLITNINTDVTVKDRIKYQDKIYRVVNVDNPVGLGRHLEVYLQRMGVDDR